MKIIKYSITKEYPNYWYATIKWGWIMRLLLWRETTTYGSENGISWFNLDTEKPAGYLIEDYLYTKLYKEKNNTKQIKKLQIFKKFYD